MYHCQNWHRFIGHIDKFHIENLFSDLYGINNTTETDQSWLGHVIMGEHEWIFVWQMMDSDHTAPIGSIADSAERRPSLDSFIYNNDITRCQSNQYQGRDHRYLDRPTSMHDFMPPVRQGTTMHGGSGIRWLRRIWPSPEPTGCQMVLFHFLEGRDIPWQLTGGVFRTWGSQTAWETAWAGVGQTEMMAKRPPSQ